MGQFLDYLSSVFTSKVEAPNKEKSGFHVTFADNSFIQAFNRSAAPSNSDTNVDLSQVLIHKNRNTIYLYQSFAIASFLIHFWFSTMPKIQLDSFDLSQPENLQLITLNFIPFVIYLASTGAMQTINRPLTEGVKVNSKNSIGLDLNKNDFSYSLKIIVLLTATSQILSIFQDQFIWTSVLTVPLWCYQLTSRLAQSEYKLYAPQPKKQWVNLNISKSPKVQSPKKEQVKVTPAKQQQNLDSAQAKATPRTRIRRAVKNISTGVSDKYHAFEQNVAHQLSQKMFNPMSPKLKMID